MNGTLVPTAPGYEPAALADLDLEGGDVVLVGERLAQVPGALSAVSELIGRTGARLAWVPRRAGDRGALETGCLPSLLPGGRPVSDAAARVDAAAVWGVDQLPAAPGRDGDGIVDALRTGGLAGLVIGGVDPADTSDPAATRAAVDQASFVVALELRATEVTRAADVVFPVAPVSDKAGSFVNWEGRVRSFEQVFAIPASLPDLRVLAGISEELAATGPRRCPRFPHRRGRLDADGGHGSVGRPARHHVEHLAGVRPQRRTSHGLVLACWKQMIDNGSMLVGDKHLAATARPAVAKVAQTVFDAVGPTVTVTGDRGSVTLPAEVARDIVDGVVWLPANSTGLGLLTDLASPGSRVTVTGGDA